MKLIFSVPRQSAKQSQPLATALSVLQVPQADQCHLYRTSTHRPHIQLPVWVGPRRQELSAKFINSITRGHVTSDHESWSVYLSEDEASCDPQQNNTFVTINLPLIGQHLCILCHARARAITRILYFSSSMIHSRELCLPSMMATVSHPSSTQTSHWMSRKHLRGRHSQCRLRGRLLL